MAVNPSEQPISAPIPPRGLRAALADGLVSLARRITPQQAAHSYALPETLTHSATQAANAARLQQQTADRKSVV